MKRFIIPIAAGVSVIVLLAACSGVDANGHRPNPTIPTVVSVDDHSDDSHTDLTGEARVIEIEASEFAFSPAAITVKAGETVDFVVTNMGAVRHEFQILDDLIVGTHAHEADHNGDGDLLLSLQPGQTKSLTVTFVHDTTLDQFGCLIPGHFEAGMAGEVAVEA